MPKYHKREKGQSKETFRLSGGRHTRPHPGGRAGDRVTMERGDTCHLTQSEADKFGDKFELVLPTKASDVELTVEDETTDPPEATTDDDDEVDVSKATGQGGPSRDDFASLRAYETWQKGGEPDLAQTARSGHNGRTYSVKDVKSAL